MLNDFFVCDRAVWTYCADSLWNPQRSLRVLMVKLQTIGSHPESQRDHSPRRAVYAIRGAGSAECRGGLLYRMGIKK
jgi:hypothetical protein